ncbi:MAG TPA: GH3 auxin-responsive promoter family protein, partial [Polyangia bacterium]
MSRTKRRVTASLRRAAHQAAIWTCAGAGRDFERALANVRATQERKLAHTLRAISDTAQAKRFDLRPGMSPEAFRGQVPETEYTDVAAVIEAQRAGAP